ncbi:MAG TPA: prepilin-type N-terminal cleavage/methylation domain-containing protein [Chthoniobacterales bacterium]|nr:prepilin-type N-terminal cleavage/methylation domain-containing protein [Chthoniobacterales bacterium]
MKLNLSLKRLAFTLPEMSVALAAGSVILGATLTSSTSLQKSFNALDNYFGTHMQQIRIVDYLSRDVKRGLIVTTSADLQTVTITVPNYVIQAGDPEALVNPALVGTPRTPTMAYTPSGWQVNYGAATSTITYSINGMSILRTENGTVTTIASSTDQLVPLTTDVELANTEYTKTSITFQPIFTSGGAPASRSGTTVYSTAYLRNKRRG